MLTTALIRFEYSEDGGFEDRATQMVCNRDFPVPEFRVMTAGITYLHQRSEIHYDRQKFFSKRSDDTCGGWKSQRACVALW